MSVYRSCPYCGANLDPGERCDCKEEAAPVMATPRAAENITTNIIAFCDQAVKPLPGAKEGRYE